MKITPWLVLLCFSLVSCSGSKSAQQVNEETPQIELSDADEFIETPTEEQPLADAPAEVVADPLADGSDGFTDDSITSAEPLVQESTLENTTPVITNDMSSEPGAMSSEPGAMSSEPGAMSQYTVQKNETLMMIAFKLYGDYARWKELANMNSGTLKGGTTITPGMTLNYTAPAEAFVWNPQGNPYLIKTGDTLGGISKEVYATVKKWKLLWENNKPLIKDPNKIYAGFTIYYLESGREVANEI